MDLFEAVAKRHSYRAGFRKEPVPRETLRKIVQAGLQAPSGKNAQTTSFVIIDNPDVVRDMNAMPNGNPAIQNARAYIACIIDHQPQAIYETHNFQIEDCAAAVENMLLAITASGLATVWIDGWLRVDNRADTIGRKLGVPEDKIIRVLLPLGVPEEAWPQKEKLPFEQRAWFNKFGGRCKATKGTIHG